jgi:hypothetical protein
MRCAEGITAKLKGIKKKIRERLRQWRKDDWPFHRRRVSTGLMNYYCVAADSTTEFLDACSAGAEEPQTKELYQLSENTFSALCPVVGMRLGNSTLQVFWE